MSERRPVPHYMNGGLEVIDILRAKLTTEEYRGFCLGNALKYLFRYKFKGTPVEDLHKAETYTRWLREDLEKDLEKGLATGPQPLSSST